MVPRYSLLASLQNRTKKGALKQRRDTPSWLGLIESVVGA